MGFKKFGVPDESGSASREWVLAPAALMRQDAARKLAEHVPGHDSCSCGATAAGAEWPEHAAGVLFPEGGR